MPNIVAGNFEDQQQADRALRALRGAGFAPDAMTCFALNAPGQHDNLPLGGDKPADETAAGSEKGAIAGAGIGTGVGLALGVAATPLVGPVGLAAGAGVGALVGSISGALNSLSENAERRGDPPERPAGVLVAVHAPDSSLQERALTTLVEAGAREIETADGTWTNGRWMDFDPVSAPESVDQVHPLTGSGAR